MMKQFCRQKGPTRSVKHFRFSYSLPLHAGNKPKPSDYKLFRMSVPARTKTEAKKIFLAAFLGDVKIESIEC